MINAAITAQMMIEKPSEINCKNGMYLIQQLNPAAMATTIKIRMADCTPLFIQTPSFEITVRTKSYAFTPAAKDRLSCTKKKAHFLFAHSLEALDGAKSNT